MIDFVITWVDGSDPKWLNAMYSHRATSGIDTVDSARYRDLGTLKYLFRGIEKYTPWVNNIYLITEGHLPEWLDASHKKIKTVQHADIFRDPSVLPVFNSNAIEMNVCGIDSLSDKFVLFNDDFLVMQPLSESDFFVSGKPCDFLIDNILKGALARVIYFLYPEDTWFANILGNHSRLNEKFPKKRLMHSGCYGSYGFWGNFKNLFSLLSNKYLFIEHFHHPQPYLKDVWMECLRTFENDISVTCGNKFRSVSDVTHYLFRYVQLATGRFHPRLGNNFKTFNVDSVRAAEKCIRCIDSYTHVCINDVPKLSDDDFCVVKELTVACLESKFPTKSGFEL